MKTPKSSHETNNGEGRWAGAENLYRNSIRYKSGYTQVQNVWLQIICVRNTVLVLETVLVMENV